MSSGPFDLPADPFLQLYVVLLVAAVVASLVIPRWLRPDGRNRTVIDPDELAWLAGGRARFVDALVARLLAARALVLVGSDRFTAERGTLGLAGPVRWTEVERAARPLAEPVEERLVVRGLLIDRGTAIWMRWWQTSPYLLLLLFGALRRDLGVERERPVGFLTALLIATAVAALVRWGVVDRRTRGGAKTLREARARSDRMRRAPMADETGFAVALFGTAVLAGSAYGDFHRLRAASFGDGASGASDTGGDRGGCGGGGCGGCGS